MSHGDGLPVSGMLTQRPTLWPDETARGTTGIRGDTDMTDETFNMSLRKFLKTVGVTSQQEIEVSVRAAREKGSLPDGPLKATAVIRIEALDLEHVIEGHINTDQD